MKKKHPEVQQGGYNTKLHIPECEFLNAGYIKIVIWSRTDNMRIERNLDCFDTYREAELMENCNIITEMLMKASW